jgi:hypothetical protein
MGYYVRAFCKASTIPSLAVIQTWLHEHEHAPGVWFADPNHTADEPSGPALSASDLQSPDWTQVELVYKPGKLPIVVECNRDDEPDSLVRAEVAEFRELIGEPKRSTAKRRVLDHLAETKFIVACQLLSDIDDDGYEANYQFLNYFVQRCAGIIQADGEGFYDGDKIIIKVQ